MKVAGIPFVQGRNDYGPMTAYGIAIHCTDNTASAENEAAYATRRTDGVGSHFYVDHDSVVQSIDTARRTGHAGSYNGNHYAIAVEITGKTSWSRTRWLSDVDWDALARALATVCKKHDITPRRASVDEMKRNSKVRAFYGHNDMRLAWGGTTHTDPGPNFPWDHLISRVKAAMSGGQEEDKVTPAEFVKILQDPTVLAIMRAIPWQYSGGGIPSGMSTLNVLNGIFQFTKRLADATPGTDTDAILNRINALAVEEAERDAGAALLLADIRETLDEMQSGGATAEEIVDELSNRLRPAEAPAPVQPE